MYVVVWEPKHGRGGGHQAVLYKEKAEKLCQRLAWERPDHVFRAEPADAYAAAAVIDRDQRRHRPRA